MLEGNENQKEDEDDDDEEISLLTNPFELTNLYPEIDHSQFSSSMWGIDPLIDDDV